MPDDAHEPASPSAPVRLGGAADTDVVARMFELWPGGPLAEHREDAARPHSSATFQSSILRNGSMKRAT
jgi:hypothetical protein